MLRSRSRVCAIKFMFYGMINIVTYMPFLVITVKDEVKYSYIYYVDRTANYRTEL
jgi:hypothetical protein